MPEIGVETWLSPAQAASRLGVGPERVRQLARAGRVAYVFTPLGRLLDPASVERLVAERRMNDWETISLI